MCEEGPPGSDDDGEEGCICIVAVHDDEGHDNDEDDDIDEDVDDISGAGRKSQVRQCLGCSSADS